MLPDLTTNQKGAIAETKIVAAAVELGVEVNQLGERIRIRGYNRASKRCGAIAQLGERLAGSQKVAGSSPAGSTL